MRKIVFEPQILKQFLDEYLSGISGERLAEKYSISGPTAYRFIKEAGILRFSQRKPESIDLKRDRKCTLCLKIKEYLAFGTKTTKRGTWLNARCKDCQCEISKNLRLAKEPLVRWARTVFHASKTRAERGGLAHSITFDFICELGKNSLCTYCGKTVIFGKKSEPAYRDAWASLDRFEPNKGYTFSNTYLSCVRCNTIKNDANLNEIEQIYRSMLRITTSKTN